MWTSSGGRVECPVFPQTLAPKQADWDFPAATHWLKKSTFGAGHWVNNEMCRGKPCKIQEGALLEKTEKPPCLHGKIVPPLPLPFSSDCKLPVQGLYFPLKLGASPG